MAFIVEQLVGDKGVQIGYEEIIRPFSFGTNWNKIRVGVLWALNGYPSGLPNLTYPWIGICTGNGGRLATATDAIYIPYGHDVTGAGLYVGSLPAVAWQTTVGSSSTTCRQKVGDTISNLSLATGSIHTQISANPANHMTAAMFTLTKGTVATTVDYQLVYVTGGGTAGTTPMTRGMFLAQMENEVSAVSPMSQATVTGATLPLRSVKDWNSMLAGWLRSTPTLCINCMTVVRFQ